MNSLTKSIVTSLKRDRGIKLLLFGYEIQNMYRVSIEYIVGGTVAAWLVCSTPERAVRMKASSSPWARHFTLTVPLSTQVYKWVPAKLMLGDNPAMD